MNHCGDYILDFDLRIGLPNARVVTLYAGTRLRIVMADGGRVYLDHPAYSGWQPISIVRPSVHRAPPRRIEPWTPLTDPENAHPGALAERYPICKGCQICRDE